jgi:transposase InsO family protein
MTKPTIPYANRETNITIPLCNHDARATDIDSYENKENKNIVVEEKCTDRPEVASEIPNITFSLNNNKNIGYYEKKDSTIAAEEQECKAKQKIKCAMNSEYARLQERDSHKNNVNITVAESVNEPKRENENEEVIERITGIYAQNLTIAASIVGQENKTIHSLIDTGSNYSLIKKEILPNKYGIIESKKKRFVGVSSEEIRVHGKVENLELEIGNKKFVHNMIVVSGINSDLIMGLDFIFKNGIKIDGETRQIKAKGEVLMEIDENWIATLIGEVRDKDDELSKEKSAVIHEEKITLIEDVWLPPESSKTLRIETKNEDRGKKFRTKPHLIAKGITTKISQTETEMKLEVRNRRKLPQTLRRKQRIAETQKSWDEIINATREQREKEEKIPDFKGDETLKDEEGCEIKISRELTKEQRIEALKLLHKYRHLFTNKLTKISKVKAPPYKINVKKDAPVAKKPYPLTIVEREKARTLLRELEEAEVIRKSRSAYSSPGFLKAKGGSSESRLLVDFREVNKLLADDTNCPVRIDTVIESLQDAEYFSGIDLISGYYQFEIAEESKHITAFRMDSTPAYEFQRLPMGLKPSSAALTRAVIDIFEEDLFDGMTAYLDDLCIYAKTFEEEIARLRKALEKLEKHNFKLKTSKCEFFIKKIKLLGFEIEKGRVTPSDRNVKAIKELPAPKNVKQARGLISSFSYFRKFLPEFTKIAQPILELIRGKEKGSEKIKWEKMHEDAFNKLKEIITSKPILQIFDPTRETILMCDGSANAVGAMLLQKDPQDGQEKPVGFFSQRLPETKKHLCSYDLELIAITKALQHFRLYLQGRKFTIRTDHKNLTSKNLTASKTMNLARLRRIIDQLQNYDFEIEHVAGKENVIADMLSRNVIVNNVSQVEKSEEEDNKFIEAQTEDKETAGIMKILRREKLDETYSQAEKMRLERTSRRCQVDPETGVLCVKKYNRGEELLLPYVPQKLKPEIVKEIHDSPMVGAHTGIHRTYIKIANKLFWKGLYTDVKNYVESCPECQAYKKSKMKTSPIAERKKKEERILNELYLDSCGPFKFSTTREIHVLSAIDKFSKYIFTRAYHTMDTETVIRFLEEIITNYPTPKTIHMDNASYFTSTQLSTYLRENGIEKKFSPAYSPRCSGAVERSHSGMSTAIKALIDQGWKASEIKDWIKKLQKAYNTCPHPLLEYKSPHYVLFGEEDRYLEGKFQIPDTTPEKKRAERLSELEEFRRKIPDLLHKNYERDAKYFNKNRREIKFNVDDEVLIRNPHPSKLSKTWIGPMRVVEKISPRVLILEGENGRRERLHTERMKKYHRRR